MTDDLVTPRSAIRLALRSAVLDEHTHRSNISHLEEQISEMREQVISLQTEMQRSIGKQAALLPLFAGHISLQEAWGSNYDGLRFDPQPSEVAASDPVTDD